MPPLRIDVIPARRLTLEQTAAWSRLQQADPTLDSPYFRPEFTQAVAAVRDDVEVALLQDDQGPAGFFPFQRGRFNVGRPVGGRLCDVQGVVARRGLSWAAEDLLRGCGLSSWHFDHLVASQQPFAAWHRGVADSPYMDLSQGFEAYRAERQAAGSYRVKHTLTKSRKLAREVGPLRFEPGTTDPQVFETLIRWKSEQYRSTGLTDVFSFPWTVALLERVLSARTEQFSGMLSALYVGGRLAAIDFGIRSGGVLHTWFPAYDRELACYSPGMVLSIEIAQAAPSLGIRRIDLGKGDEPYKTSLRSGGVRVAEGSVELRPLAAALQAGWRSLRERIRSSPLEKMLGGPAVAFRRLREHSDFS